MKFLKFDNLNLDKKYKRLALCAIPLITFYLLDYILIFFLSHLLYNFAGENYSLGIKLVYIVKSIIISPAIIYICFDLYKNYDLFSSSNDYSNKNFQILKKITFYIVFSVILEGILSSIIYSFITPIFNLFNFESGIINYAVHSAKILLISSTILCIQFVISIYFFVNKKYLHCLFLFLVRQILFSIPLALVFYKVWNLKGILFAIPTADALSVLLCVIVFTISIKRK